MRILGLVLSLLLVGLVPQASAQTAWPDTAPAAWGLAHVDVETTGLDPSFHEMIDAGIIYTDLDGEELGRLYVRISPTHPERIDPGAKAVNGFDLAYWRAHGAVSEEEAVAQIAAFHARVGAGRTMLFTAYNSWFDQAFMSALLREHGRDWRAMYHYHVLDIPSMAIGQGFFQVRGRGLAEALGVPAETSVPLEHIGMTGAEFNVSIYRALRARGLRLAIGDMAGADAAR